MLNYGQGLPVNRNEVIMSRSLFGKEITVDYFFPEYKKEPFVARKIE